MREQEREGSSSERAGECVQGVDSSGYPLLGCPFFVSLPGTSVPVYEGEDLVFIAGNKFMPPPKGGTSCWEFLWASH